MNKASQNTSGDELADDEAHVGIGGKVYAELQRKDLGGVRWRGCGKLLINVNHDFDGGLTRAKVMHSQYPIRTREEALQQ